MGQNGAGTPQKGTRLSTLGWQNVVTTPNITRCPNAADTSVLSSFLYYRGGWGQPGDRAGGQRWAQAGSSAGGSSSSESNSAFSSFTHLPEGSWIQPALERDGQMDRGREQRLLSGFPAPGRVGLLTSAAAGIAPAPGAARG